MRITDHPAFVQAVVDFSGAAVAGSHMEATDPRPADGTANLLVSDASVASRVPVRTAHRVTVRVVEVPSGLSVRIGALPGAFKYLSYSITGGDQLAVDLWKSTFAPAGDIPRGKGNCLTLSGVSTTPGTVRASGTAHRLFENQFRAVLRDSFGHVLATRAVTASGRWSVAVHYTAPQGQGASFEAVASSAKDGALACLVQKAFCAPRVKRAREPEPGLPSPRRRQRRPPDRSRHAGHISASKGKLTVMLAGGGRLSVTTPSDAVWLPDLVAAGNVDGRPGEELFVDVTHVTTAESISIYTYRQAHLVKAGTLSAYGYDFGILYGLTCSVKSTRHFITEHDFSLKFGTHPWMRQDTVYVWHGATLKRLARHAATLIKGQPSPTLVDVQCGHPL